MKAPNILRNLERNLQDFLLETNYCETYLRKNKLNKKWKKAWTDRLGNTKKQIAELEYAIGKIKS